MGNVGDRNQAADVSKTTAASDAAHWKSLGADTVENISKIDAPDDVVAAVARAVSENNPYAMVPIADDNGRPADIGQSNEVNSNSAGFAVGDKAEQIATGNPDAQVDRQPFELALPGAGESRRVQFKCTGELKSAGGC